MAGKTSKASRIFVWVILVLLIVGLAGFGATNFGGNLRSIGTVGDVDISVDRFARELDQELTSLSAQVGRTVTLEEGRGIGIDRRVLERLVGSAAIEHETGRIGLSVGDAEIGRQLQQTPQFQGPSGAFDQRTYEFVLERSGTNPSEYEETVRTEMAVTLLQAAVSAGVQMPDSYGQLVADYLGETRSFSLVSLVEADLPDPIGTPTAADLQALYDADPTAFMLPEQRDITYAWLSPDQLVDTLQIDDADVLGLYEERADQYNQPERRLLERLVFANTDAAQAAADAIASGAQEFDAIVAERGLELEDIDLGDVGIDALGAAGAVVFAATDPGVIGPVDTSLGPALFRINAILAARETPFEDVAEDLRAEFAGDRARRVISDQITDFDDLLAGGATIEDLANETDMQLGNLTWSAGSTDGLAAYSAFAQAAAFTTTDDFPQIIELEDGGLVALRVNSITDASPDAFDSATPRVETAWRSAAITSALTALGEDLATQAGDGARLSSLGYITDVLTRVERVGRVGGLPNGVVAQVFDLETGAALSVADGAVVHVVQLDEIIPADMEDGQTAQLVAAVTDSVNQAAAVDMLDYFTRHVQNDAGISINQTAFDAVITQLIQQLPR